MSISRDTFDPAKRYRRLRFHQDRDLLDSELNEWQALWAWLTKRLVGAFLKDGSILDGLEPTITEVRFIEVKGRAGVGEVALSSNEYKTAQRLQGDFWLYVAFSCASTPKLLTVQNPSSLPWKEVVRVEHYVVAAALLGGQ